MIPSGANALVEARRKACRDRWDSKASRERHIVGYRVDDRDAEKFVLLDNGWNAPEGLPASEWRGNPDEARLRTRFRPVELGSWIGMAPAKGVHEKVLPGPAALGLYATCANGGKETLGLVTVAHAAAAPPRLWKADQLPYRCLQPGPRHGGRESSRDAATFQRHDDIGFPLKHTAIVGCPAVNTVDACFLALDADVQQQITESRFELNRVGYPVFVAEGRPADRNILGKVKEYQRPQKWTGNVDVLGAYCEETCDLRAATTLLKPRSMVPGFSSGNLRVVTSPHPDRDDQVLARVMCDFGLITRILSESRIRVPTEVFHVGPSGPIAGTVCGCADVYGFCYGQPDEHVCAFSQLLLVRGVKGQPFVQKGDSGAVVVTRQSDGIAALGMVLGAIETKELFLALVQPLARVLKELDLREYLPRS
jgi:hypothetical protein